WFDRHAGSNGWRRVLPFLEERAIAAVALGLAEHFRQPLDDGWRSFGAGRLGHAATESDRQSRIVALECRRGNLLPDDSDAVSRLAGSGLGLKIKELLPLWVGGQRTARRHGGKSMFDRLQNFVGDGAAMLTVDRPHFVNFHQRNAVLCGRIG